MSAAGLGIFYNGKAMRQAQLIADPAQSPGGTPKVTKFPGTFQIHRAHDDVIMNMVLIYVRANDKSVVSLRQPHSKFLADLIGDVYKRQSMLLETVIPFPTASFIFKLRIASIPEFPVKIVSSDSLI